MPHHRMLNIARDIAHRFHGSAPVTVDRFPTGRMNVVCAVEWPDRTQAVVRLAPPSAPRGCEGALYWAAQLRPLGVPLPEILAHGTHRGVSYVILERLPGTDLGHVYAQLTGDDLSHIASEVCAIRARLDALPDGPGYGDVRWPGDTTQQTWAEVVAASIAKSAAMLATAGTENLRRIARSGAWADAMAPYFATIRPRPFLDDLTTKNVLVAAGRVTGIVDVDWVCYGDPLSTVGMTHAALLADGHHTAYTEAWGAQLSLTSTQWNAVRFYAVCSGLCFLGEQDQDRRRSAHALVSAPVSAGATRAGQIGAMMDRLMEESGRP